jgi:hypothetical protein
MWPPTVVVGAVPGEGGLQMPFGEDRDAIGEFGSGGEHEGGGCVATTYTRTAMSYCGVVD